MSAKIKIPDSEEFKHKYENKTLIDLAKEYNVSKNIIRRWSKSFGLTKIIPFPNKRMFKKYYFEHSRKQSSNKYGVSGTTLDRWCKHFELKTPKPKNIFIICCGFEFNR